jgi:hypothetical protein
MLLLPVVFDQYAISFLICILESRSSGKNQMAEYFNSGKEKTKTLAET